MNRLSFFVSLLVLAFAASACSSGQSGSGLDIGVEGESASSSALAPNERGVMYVSTTGGDLLTVDPARQSAGILWRAGDNDQLPVSEVAPANGASGVHIAFNDPARGLYTSLNILADGSLRAIENDPLGHLVTCLDNHVGADTAVAHQILLAPGANGSQFAAIDFNEAGNVITDPLVPMNRPSMVCPRWSSDRAINITSTPLVDNDFSTVAMHIESGSTSHAIAVDNCNLVASSITPDDAAAVVNVTCYGERWTDSGLYLLELNNLVAVTGLSDMRLIAPGVFGRSAIHPDGLSIAAARTDAVAGQAATTDFGAADSALAIVDIASGDVQELQLPLDSKPHSIAWLAQPAH